MPDDKPMFVMSNAFPLESPYFPDIRYDMQDGPFGYFLPKHVQKKEVLNRDKPKEKRDWLTNKFMAKPDWDEPHKKVYYAGYFGAKFATAWSVIEISAMESRNPAKALQIAGKNFFFIGGWFLTYGAVLAAAANIRGKKNDVLNHTIAGASTGFIYGYAMRSPHGGAIMAAVGGIIGSLFKAWYNDGRVSPFYFAEHGIPETSFLMNMDYRVPGRWAFTNTHNTQTRSERVCGRW